jgi:hypothetical protein
MRPFLFSQALILTLTFAAIFAAEALGLGDAMKVVGLAGGTVAIGATAAYYARGDKSD